MGSRLDSIENWETRAAAADFRVDRLAKHCGITERQLRRYIYLKFECSPRIWITQIRLERAQSLIRQGKLIKEAAVEVRFEHQGSLSRRFRARFNRSPSTFRLGV
jgi:AraC-like DNA-binding protein